MTKETAPEKLIGYVFQLVTSLSDRQQLTISGNLGLNAAKEEMGVEFDKLVAVTSRLSARHRAVEKKAQIADGKIKLNALEEDMKHADATIDLSKKTSPERIAEENARQSNVRLMRNLKGTIAGYEAELIEIEKEAE